MKEIPLTQGKVALVDDEDFEYLNQWKWHAEKGRCSFYARRRFRLNNGKQGNLRMHEAIMGKGVRGVITPEHKDGNGLNNQRGNLRNATHRQNMQNLHIPKTSRFPGVSFDKARGKWTAHVQTKGKVKSLGRFLDEEVAFSAYREKIESMGETVVERCQNY